MNMTIVPLKPSHEVSPETIDQIIQLVRWRRRWIKAKNALVLQGKALCRAWAEGDKDEGTRLYNNVANGTNDNIHLNFALSPFLSATEPFVTQIEQIEKQLSKIGKTLPIWNEWGKDVKGLSALGVTLIVGECGNLSNYENPAKVWRRMGLAVLNGHRQGNPGKAATADDWIEEGYNKERRSVMWNIGNGLILGMGKFRPMFGSDLSECTEYQRIFVERCRYEANRLPHADGSTVKQSKTGKESYTLHAGNRAKRYVEKRFLRDMWEIWNDLHTA